MRNVVISIHITCFNGRSCSHPRYAHCEAPQMDDVEGWKEPITESIVGGRNGGGHNPYPTNVIDEGITRTRNIW